ncbi:MAG: glycosyltransferase family 2 protein [Flavobacterium sp.]
MNPEVSIVVPVYNVEHYLDKCIESMLAQTYTNFEVVLVNDGATDNSGKICDAWAQKDSRIKVVHKQNGGVASARNAGIEKSKGEYLYFVDPDDYIVPNLLQENIESCKGKAYDIIIFGFVKDTVKADGSVTQEPVYANNMALDNQEEIRSGLVEYLSSSNGFSLWTKIVRKGLFTENGIEFPKMRRGEDIFVSLDLYRNAKSIKINKGAYYHYLIASNTNKSDPELIPNHILNFKKLYNLFYSKGDSKKLNYIFKVFMLWFFYVVPANIVGDKKASMKEKVNQLRVLMDDTDIQKYVSVFLQKPGLSKIQKVYLKLFRAKSARIFYLLTAGLRFIKNNSLLLSKKRA